MDVSEGLFIAVLAFVNLVLGFGLAIPVTRLLRQADERPRRRLPCFIAVVGVYFLECVAFAAGMATQVFSLGLAVVWGMVLGLWLPHRTSHRSGVKIALSVAAYSTLPTLSLCAILPVAFSLGQQSVLSIEDGLRFGLPPFLPRPFNTVLGFCSVLAVSTLLAKMVITTGGTCLLLSLRPKTTNAKTHQPTRTT